MKLKQTNKDINAYMFKLLDLKNGAFNTRFLSC